MSPAALRARAASFLIVLAVAAPALADEKLVTGFDPKTDGLPYTNVGSYASANGDCFGMSVVALLRFQARTRGEARARDAYDLSGRALAGAIQNRYLTEWDRGLSANILPALVPVSDPRSGERILERLRAGTPVVAHLQADARAHAVLFFGYEDGAFRIYDPDKPGETMKWGFSSKRGFSGWTLTYGSVKSLTIYSAEELAALPTLASLEALRDDCDRLGRECAAPFATVDAGVSAREGVAVVVTGTVSGGLPAGPDGRAAEKPDQVVVFVNGQAAETVRLDKTGRFEVKLPASLFQGESNTVRVAATATSKERLAGFAELAAPRVAGTGAPSRTRGLASAIGGD